MPARTSSPLPLLGEPADRQIAAKVKARLRKSSRIIITGHERPDGDCIGSEVALCAILRAAGYRAAVVNSDATAPRYQFLDPDGLARRMGPDERLKADVVFVLDATDARRLGRVKLESLHGATVINIDHHLDNPEFGAVNWVDRGAAATGELIWRLAAACKWRVPPVAQDALYAALVTDTGQFSYSNTTPRVLRMAAELVERGVDPERVWQKIYLNKSRAELALEARARASLEYVAGGKICTIALRHSDFAATGTGPQHTEEFAHIPRSVAGMQMALFFYEVVPGKLTKVSVRTTRNLNACALAKKFGGGGHRQAAGCSIPSGVSAAKRRFLAEAVKFVEPGKE